MKRARARVVVVSNSYKLDYARCKLIGKMHECRERSIWYAECFMRECIALTLAMCNLTKLKPISRL